MRATRLQQFSAVIAGASRAGRTCMSLIGKALRGRDWTSGQRALPSTVQPTHTWHECR